MYSILFSPTTTHHVAAPRITSYHYLSPSMPQRSPNDASKNALFGLEVCFFIAIYISYSPTTSQHQPLPHSINRCLTTNLYLTPQSPGTFFFAIYIILTYHIHSTNRYLKAQKQTAQTTRPNVSFGLEVCFFLAIYIFTDRITAPTATSHPHGYLTPPAATSRPSITYTSITN
jgi:hypothetical protein